MTTIYSEIRDDLRYVADALEENGFHDVEIYNRGVQYNVADYNGVIQTFYPTTGTIVFHHGNDRNDRATYSLHNSDINEFMQFLSDPEKIQQFFAT